MVVLLTYSVDPKINSMRDPPPPTTINQNAGNCELMLLATANFQAIIGWNVWAKLEKLSRRVWPPDLKYDISVAEINCLYNILCTLYK